MRRLVMLLLVPAALVCGQDLSGVRSVYLLPMSQGLDQYLANRLTSERIFQVVTDPKLADAIFTDRIGKAFEDKLADLTPNPEPVAKPAADKGDKAGEGQSGNTLADLISSGPGPQRDTSLGRSKGMVFLVNPKSHLVLWSAYQRPKDSSSGQLDRTASDIVSRLKRELKAK